MFRNAENRFHLILAERSYPAGPKAKFIGLKQHVSEGDREVNCIGWMTAGHHRLGFGGTCNENNRGLTDEGLIHRRAGKLLFGLCVLNDDELPFLPIIGGRRKPAGFQYFFDFVVLNLQALVGPDASPPLYGGRYIHGLPPHYVKAVCIGQGFKKKSPARVHAMKIAFVVAQKTRAVFIDVPAHGSTIQISHDRIAAAACCAFKCVHRVVIEFFLHLHRPGV